MNHITGTNKLAPLSYLEHITVSPAPYAMYQLIVLERIRVRHADRVHSGAALIAFSRYGKLTTSSISDKQVLYTQHYSTDVHRKRAFTQEAL